MKIIFSSISRLIFAYSKFFTVLVLLSSIGTFAHSSEGPTYLKCNDSYYRLTGFYLSSNYNVRTKKFKDSYKIESYNENYISARWFTINRNNGELSIGQKVMCVAKKITVHELPKLNGEGKLF